MIPHNPKLNPKPYNPKCFAEDCQPVFRPSPELLAMLPPKAKAPKASTRAAKPKAAPQSSPSSQPNPLAPYFKKAQA